MRSPSPPTSSGCGPPRRRPWPCWPRAPRVPVFGYPPRTFALFLALAVVPTVIGHGLVNRSLRHIPAPTVGLFLLGEPIAASILAYAVFGETPGAPHHRGRSAGAGRAGPRRAQRGAHDARASTCTCCSRAGRSRCAWIRARARPCPRCPARRSSPASTACGRKRASPSRTTRGCPAPTSRPTGCGVCADAWRRRWPIPRWTRSSSPTGRTPSRRRRSSSTSRSRARSRSSSAGPCARCPIRAGTARPTS